MPYLQGMSTFTCVQWFFVCSSVDFSSFLSHARRGFMTRELDCKAIVKALKRVLTTPMRTRSFSNGFCSCKKYDFGCCINTDGLLPKILYQYWQLVYTSQIISDKIICYLTSLNSVVFNYPNISLHWRRKCVLPAKIIKFCN